MAASLFEEEVVLPGEEEKKEYGVTVVVAAGAGDDAVAVSDAFDADEPPPKAADAAAVATSDNDANKPKLVLATDDLGVVFVGNDAAGADAVAGAAAADDVSASCGFLQRPPLLMAGWPLKNSE